MRSPSPNSAYGRRAASGRDCVPDRIRSATLLFVRWGQHRGQNPNLRTDAIHLGRSNQKTRLARHLTDCVGQAHGAGGGRVSPRVPSLWRRHPADRVHHGARADPEDSAPPGRASQVPASLARSGAAYRLGRNCAGPRRPRHLLGDG